MGKWINVACSANRLTRAACDGGVWVWGVGRGGGGGGDGGGKETELEAQRAHYRRRSSTRPVWRGSGEAAFRARATRPDVSCGSASATATRASAPRKSRPTKRLLTSLLACCTS